MFPELCPRPASFCPPPEVELEAGVSPSDPHSARPSRRRLMLNSLLGRWRKIKPTPTPGSVGWVYTTSPSSATCVGGCADRPARTGLWHPVQRRGHQLRRRGSSWGRQLCDRQSRRRCWRGRCCSNGWNCRPSRWGPAKQRERTSERGE
jgi:hypothetical protein